MGYSRYAHQGKGLTDSATRKYASKLTPGSSAHKKYTTFVDKSGVRRARGSFDVIGHTASTLGYGGVAAGGVTRYSSPIGPGISASGAVLFDAPIGGGSFFTGKFGSISDYESLLGVSSASPSSSGGVVSEVLSETYYPGGGGYGAEGDPSNKGLYVGAALLLAALYFHGRKKR